MKWNVPTAWFVIMCCACIEHLIQNFIAQLNITRKGTCNLLIIIVVFCSNDKNSAERHIDTWSLLACGNNVPVPLHVHCTCMYIINVFKNDGATPLW